MFLNQLRGNAMYHCNRLAFDFLVAATLSGLAHLELKVCLPNYRYTSRFLPQVSEGMTSAITHFLY
jgi:hypothetical protein